MEKQAALSMLRMARSAHIQWRARAQSLVAGIEVDQDGIPILYTDCKFGKWYYGDGQELNELESFRAIEEPHQQLHLVYMEIFKKVCGDERCSLLKRVFHSKKQHRQEQLAAAKVLLAELVDISKTLLSLIDALERDLKTSP